MTQYYVRFDDICPTMSYSMFTKAIELMNEYSIKPLLGVIPKNEDPSLIIDNENKEFWETIKKLQNKGFTVAMHGYTHVYDQEAPNTILCGKKHSEFAGHSYELQLFKIRQGKEILESHDIFTDVFFAPGHSYDKNTLKALRDSGFKYISDGMSNKPYKQCGIICLPCKSFGISQRITGINVAVNHSNEWLEEGKKEDYDKLVNYCLNNEISDFNELLCKKPGVFFIQKGIEIVNKQIEFRIKPLYRLIRKKN